jgi:hypothetical protein
MRTLTPKPHTVAGCSPIIIAVECTAGILDGGRYLFKPPPYMFPNQEYFEPMPSQWLQRLPRRAYLRVSTTPVPCSDSQGANGSGIYCFQIPSGCEAPQNGRDSCQFSNAYPIRFPPRYPTMACFPIKNISRAAPKNGSSQGPSRVIQKSIYQDVLGTPGTSRPS